VAVAAVPSAAPIAAIKQRRFCDVMFTLLSENTIPTSAVYRSCVRRVRQGLKNSTVCAVHHAGHGAGKLIVAALCLDCDAGKAEACVEFETGRVRSAINA
jgi:hypothetical protein